MTEQIDSIEQNNSGEDLFALFRRVFKHMARAHHQQGHGRHAQRHILSILRERGSMNQRELMEMLNVRSASLSEILGKLERHGLASRERDGQDRRNLVIAATEDGNRAVGEHECERRKQAENLFAALDADERAKLAELLEKLALALEADEAARGEAGGDANGEADCHGCGRHSHGPRGRHCPGHTHDGHEGRERREHHVCRPLSNHSRREVPSNGWPGDESGL
ncbi:MAG: MarR family winged helix-turn-helix transcriptional regulator [Deltaproteobacteria bacterium]|jgi:DNA-binding MarR family transcriptional regulator|nr:MarR family winged helix-turn-helix transcriptional regulator [Deltaproteobacteria bacterium]